MSDFCAPPVTDHLPILLRAFAKPVSEKSGSDEFHKGGSILQGPSDWTLTFDCETTTDASQKPRFGTYQYRKHGELIESGIFYNADNITSDEYRALKEYAAQHGLELITLNEFINEIFFELAYKLRAAIVGFNLPFDLSRIAIGHGSAKKSYGGGFSLKLSLNKRLPNVRVLHQSSKAAFIQFAAPFKGRSNRSMQKRGEKSPVRRGHFIDVKTLSFA